MWITVSLRPPLADNITEEFRQRVPFSVFTTNPCRYIWGFCLMSKYLLWRVIRVSLYTRVNCKPLRNVWIDSWHQNVNVTCRVFPGRIQYCSQEIVIIREDLVNKMCRNCVRLPNNNLDIPNHVSFSFSEPTFILVKFLSSNSIHNSIISCVVWGFIFLLYVVFNVLVILSTVSSP